jgi:ABC-type proline/glycine betaine transport system permease subunit
VSAVAVHERDDGFVDAVAAIRWLRDRDQELFPRLVRHWVLALFWVVLVVVVGALVAIAVVLGSLP